MSKEQELNNLKNLEEKKRLLELQLEALNDSPPSQEEEKLFREGLALERSAKSAEAFEKYQQALNKRYYQGQDQEFY